MSKIKTYRLSLICLGVNLFLNILLISSGFIAYTLGVGAVVFDAVAVAAGYCSLVVPVPLSLFGVASAVIPLSRKEITIKKASIPALLNITYIIVWVLIVADIGILK